MTRMSSILRSIRHSSSSKSIMYSSFLLRPFSRSNNRYCLLLLPYIRTLSTPSRSLQQRKRPIPLRSAHHLMLWTSLISSRTWPLWSVSKSSRRTQGQNPKLVLLRKYGVPIADYSVEIYIQCFCSLYDWLSYRKGDRRDSNFYIDGWAFFCEEQRSSIDMLEINSCMIVQALSILLVRHLLDLSTTGFKRAHSYHPPVLRSSLQQGPSLLLGTQCEQADLFDPSRILSHSFSFLRV